jgi:hypothetical protein
VTEGNFSVKILTVKNIRGSCSFINNAWHIFPCNRTFIIEFDTLTKREARPKPPQQIAIA